MSRIPGAVTIRIWSGCKALIVLTVAPGVSATVPATGGAANSTRPDIELDPWAGLIVDHRVDNPTPVAIAPERDGESAAVQGAARCGLCGHDLKIVDGRWWHSRSAGDYIASHPARPVDNRGDWREGE